MEDISFLEIYLLQLQTCRCTNIRLVPQLYDIEIFLYKCALTTASTVWHSYKNYQKYRISVYYKIDEICVIFLYCNTNFLPLFLYTVCFCCWYVTVCFVLFCFTCKMGRLTLHQYTVLNYLLTEMLIFVIFIQIKVISVYVFP